MTEPTEVKVRFEASAADAYRLIARMHAAKLLGYSCVICGGGVPAGRAVVECLLLGVAKASP